MNGHVADTTVWIDYSRGIEGAVRFLSSARSAGRVTYSIVSLMELIIGADDARHQRKLESIFRAFEALKGKSIEHTSSKDNRRRPLSA